MNLIQDAISASNPGTAKQFLGSVGSRPIGQMVMYVALLGLIGMVCTVIGLSVIGVNYGVGFMSVSYKVPIMWAVLSGLIGWIGTIVAVVGGGMIIAALSQGMIGRPVSNEEAVTLAGLAASPVLLAGVFNLLPGLGGIIVLLASLYAAFVFYMGAGARFGEDKAIIVTIVYIAALVVISLVFGAIAGAVMMASYNPYSAYGAHNMMEGFNAYGAENMGGFHDMMGRYGY